MATQNDQTLPVQAEGVLRRFGRRPALAGVDLEVRRGQIVGLVGPNGSGKTTLLKILAGFLWPDAGTVRVFGHEPRRRRARIMTRARFVFAPPALFDALTAREHLVYLSHMRTPDMPEVSVRDIDSALDTVGLEDRAEDRVRAFSFGMRQRLALAQALLPLPDLLVLDEPTDGLDPLAVLDLRAVLKRLRDERGTTILLSSHLMVEIDRLVDHMLVLSEGRPLFSGTPDGLSAGGRRLCVVVSDPVAALGLLRERGLDAAPGERGSVELPAGSLTLADARDLFAGQGLELTDFHTRRPTLEQALLERLRGDRRDRGVAS